MPRPPLPKRAARAGRTDSSLPGPRPPSRGEFPSPTRSAEYRAMLARLREAREQAALSQADVGRRLGRPDQFVSKSETGERRLDPIDLWRFAQVYERPVSWFLPPDPSSPHPAR